MLAFVLGLDLALLRSCSLDLDTANRTDMPVSGTCDVYYSLRVMQISDFGVLILRLYCYSNSWAMSQSVRGLVHVTSRTCSAVFFGLPIDNVSVTSVEHMYLALTCPPQSVFLISIL